MSAHAPLAPGSVSLRLYAHDGLPPPALVKELRVQAALAAAHGFDGVMTSEHHGGFPGYLPNPLQVAGWALETMEGGWAAPCPLLLTLRPAALVAEEVAWLAARFPGRVGVGVAAGALADDFEAMDVPMESVAARFAAGLTVVARALRGRADGPLAGDAAVLACAADPVPVVSAAMGVTAVRRAAAAGVGLLFDSMSTPERVRHLVEEYHAAGGSAATILIRRAWLGARPRDLMEQQVDVYRSYSADAAQAHWQGDQVAGGREPAEVAERLLDGARRAGTDALNLRIHVPGVGPEEARDQIAALGDVVPLLRTAPPR